jgi:hypothetical protein
MMKTWTTTEEAIIVASWFNDPFPHQCVTQQAPALSESLLLALHLNSIREVWSHKLVAIRVHFIRLVVKKIIRWFTGKTEQLAVCLENMWLLANAVSMQTALSGAWRDHQNMTLVYTVTILRPKQVFCGLTLWPEEEEEISLMFYMGHERIINTLLHVSDVLSSSKSFPYNWFVHLNVSSYQVTSETKICLWAATTVCWMCCNAFVTEYMTQNPTTSVHFDLFQNYVTCVSWRWYIDGRRCSIATTTPGWTIMGSGAGGVKFRELTAARLPPPGESSNL